MSRTIIVRLNISPEQFQRLYEGAVKTVNAQSVEGRVVQFPANILRPFVTHQGISGTFSIQFSQENRFQSIEKID